MNPVSGGDHLNDEKCIPSEALYILPSESSFGVMDLISGPFY